MIGNFKNSKSIFMKPGLIFLALTLSSLALANDEVNEIEEPIGEVIEVDGVTRQCFNGQEWSKLAQLILHYHRLVEVNSDLRLERQLMIDEIILHRDQIEVMTETLDDLKIERELLYNQNESDRNQVEVIKKRNRVTITTLSLSTGVLTIAMLITIIL